MTSLATQLKQLSLPGVNIGVELKKRKSLLFDSQKAASLDRDTLYSLGVNGFEGLCSDDPTLYDNFIALFNESAKGTERSVLLKEENEELDLLIKNFLRRASPYFLSRSLHKCLEWLIYRFRIEDFNADDLLLSFLPHYGTKLYARLLQLFDVSSLNRNWSWIGLIQKEGVVITKSMITEQCMKNRGFFALICGNVLESLKVYQNGAASFSNHPALRLYTLCALELAFNIKERFDEFLAQIMPHIAKGLESEVPNHKASTYMIICGIAANMDLTDEVIVFLLDMMSKHFDKKLETEYLSTVIALCQMQERAGPLPNKCIAILCSSPGISERLRHISDAYDVERFLNLLVKQLVVEISAEDCHSLPGWKGIVLDALKSLLEDFVISKALLRRTISNLIDVLCDPDEEIRRCLLSLIFSISRKHPQIFADTLNELRSKGEHVSHLNALMEMSLEFMKKEVSSPNSDISSTFDLCHAIPAFSISAMSEIVSSNPEMVKSNLVRNTIKSRLCDYKSLHEATDVLQFIKKYPQSFFYDTEEASNILINLIYQERPGTSKKSKAVLELLLSEHFISIGDELSWKITFVACDLLLFSSSAMKGLTKSILRSPFSQKKSWFSLLGQKDDLDSFISSTIANVKNRPDWVTPLHAASLKVTDLLQRKKDGYGTATRTPFHYLVNFVALKTALSESHNLGTTTAAAIYHEVIQDIQKLLLASADAELNQKQNLLKWSVSPTAFREKLKSLVVDFNSNADNSQLSFSCIDMLFQTLLESFQSLKTSGEKENCIDWQQLADISGDNSRPQMLPSIMKFKLLDFVLRTLPVKRGCENLREILRVSLPLFFSSAEMFLCFLAQFWSFQSRQSTRVHVAAEALYIAISVIQKNDIRVSKLLSAECLFVPSLVIAVGNCDESLRKAGLKVLAIIADSRQKVLYMDLVRHLVDHTDILVADQASLPTVLSSFFKTKHVKSSTKHSHKSTLDALHLHNILAKHTPSQVILALLQALRAVNSKSLCCSLMPMLNGVLDSCQEKGGNFLDGRAWTGHTAEIIQALVSRIEGGFLIVPEIRSAFFKAVKCDVKIPLSAKGDTSPQLIALGNIARDFFDDISDETQREMVRILFDILSENNALEAIRKVFKGIRLSSAHLCEEIDRFVKIRKESMSVPAKKLKSDDDVQSDDFAQTQRIFHLLELLHEKKKIINQKALLPSLFSLLEASLDVTLGGRAEYMRQLLLTVILRILQRLKQSQRDGQALGALISNMCKIEVIIHCVRSSENTQTQHHALLLLSEIASLFPEKVLHNVMAIFTFMGSHLLRKDDPYSFHVISITMNTVIPALLQTNFGATASKDMTIIRIVRTFVDALPHMPSHRKISVLSEMLSVLDAPTHLWILLLILAGSCACKSTTEQNQSSEQVEKSDASVSSHAIIDICCSVCDAHPLADQLKSLLQCLEYLLELTLGDDAVMKGRVPHDVIDVKNMTVTQLRRFHLILLAIFLRVIEKNRKSLASELRDWPNYRSVEQDTEASNAIISLLQRFYEKLFNLVDKANEHPGKFSKVLVAKIYEVISQINLVLPFKVLFEIINSLLSNESILVKRKALELLAGKLTSSTDLIDDEVSAVVSIAGRLAEIPETFIHYEGSVMEDQDRLALGHSSLATLKIAVRACGKLRPEGFTGVLKNLCDLISSPCNDIQALSAILLCLAEICSCLKAYCIPYLNSFVPAVLQFSCESRTFENEMLLFSCVAVLHRLLENLPNFLSSYMGIAIEKIATLMLLKKYDYENIGPLDDRTLAKRTSMRLNAIITITSSKIPSRTLILAIGRCQEKVRSGKTAHLTKPLCTLLSKHIEHLDKHAVMQISSVLFPILYELMDFRCHMNGKLSKSEIDEVEECSSNTTATTLLKLPENSFRTHFFELFDWSSSASDEQSRLLIYYKLMLKLSKKMKALFSLFAGRVIDGLASVLQQNVSVDESFLENEKQELLILMCDTLSCTLSNDTSGLLTKERFELLLQPLIDQVEAAATFKSAKLGTDSQLLLCDHVIPCVAQLAASVEDGACRKRLNYKVCIKTRSSLPKVRYYAIKTIEAIAEILGEEYTILLPESIPFLSELMEDDVEDVETECHKVVKRIEKFVGEPLQKYFSM